jgi:hypothetical protein
LRNCIEGGKDKDLIGLQVRFRSRDKIRLIQGENKNSELDYNLKKLKECLQQ